MSDDKREKILVRIEQILTNIASDGISVYRDMSEFETAELPAYVLLDGVENKSVGSSDRRGPQIMILQPQIFYVPVPTSNPMNIGVGPDLSKRRSLLLKSIFSDGQLSDLLGDNGYVEYRGLETDLQTGAEVKGQFRLDLAFAYVLNVTKL